MLILSPGVGAYGELGDDENIQGATTIVVRLKYEGQGEEIIKDFPDVSFSIVRFEHRPTTHIIQGSYISNHRSEDCEYRWDSQISCRNPDSCKGWWDANPGDASARQGPPS